VDPIPKLPPTPAVPGNPLVPLLRDGAGGLAQDAVTGGFAGLLQSASRLVTGAIAKTWLTTPQLTDQGRIKSLWQASLTMALTVFVVFVMAGGIIVMTHESVQTRYALRQIAPRLIVGFLAACLSLQLVGWAIRLTNALAQALLGQGFDIVGALAALGTLVLVPSLVNPAGGAVVLLILALVGMVLFVALTATFIIRLVVTILLIVSAPLALACHASPATEGAAMLWWRLLAAVLAIQLTQALGLITMLRVFSDSDGRGVAGILRGDPLINAVVSLSLVYVLIKIPVWGFRMALQRSGHHTPLLVRIATYAAARHIFRTATRGIGATTAWRALQHGALGTGSRRGALAAGAAGRGKGTGARGVRGVGGVSGGPATPGGGGFDGRRGPRQSRPAGAGGPAAGRARQLALPFKVPTASKPARPVQLALPIRVERVPRKPQPRPVPPPAVPRRARGRQLMLPGMPRRPVPPRQLTLPFDPPPKRRPRKQR
jgi:hypothetical protein